MRNFYLVITLFFLFPFCSSATIWTVINSGFTFSPAEITIDFGDSVNFTIGAAHQVREVSQTTWDANGNTAIGGGFETALGGGMLLPASLPAGTHYYVCIPHASMGMKGKIIVNPSSLVIKEGNILDFSVYPNPCNGSFQITIGHDKAISKIEVYNLMGEIVYQTNTSNSKMVIDLSGSEKGIYFVKLYANQAILTKKIVIQ